MNPEDQLGAEQAPFTQPEGPAPPAQAESVAPPAAYTNPGLDLAQTLDPPPAEVAPQPPQVYPQRGLLGIQALFTVVIFTIFVITFVVQAFQIPTGSMENTLLVGDFLLVDKLHFAGNAAPGKLLPYADIQHGDIIVFYYPVDPKQFLVKRVIGLPGDHIRLRNRTVYVNGVAQHENYVVHKTWNPDYYRDNFPGMAPNSPEVDRRWRVQFPHYVDNGEIVVPNDDYFVLGDNRDQSLDSRYWGFVPRANIIGRPLVIYLSVRGSAPASSSDKLSNSGMLAHWLHMARWDRMFRLVR
ncbi:MAG TPA: signal peptidase I [Candidatus Angelobacter sp.]|nr:signal peptidase I [Candidatus Angelobacter sp.]